MLSLQNNITLLFTTVSKISNLSLIVKQPEKLFVNNYAVESIQKIKFLNNCYIIFRPLEIKMLYKITLTLLYADFLKK